MARRSTGNQMNLDSLLDTVTNVVGFLVIVLVVVQLNVALSPAPQPQPEPTPPVAATAPADNEAAEIERKLERDIAAAREQADALAGRIKTLRADLAGQPAPEAFAGRAKSMEGQARRMAGAVARIQARTTTAEAELARLGRQIKALENRPDTPPETVTLTGVRVFSILPTLPAKSRKERVDYVCRRGRVYPLDVKRLDTEFSKGLQAALGNVTFTPGRLSQAHLTRIVAYFQTHDVGDPYFRFRVKPLTIGGQTLMAIHFEPRRDTQGDALQAVRGGASQHEAALRTGRDPNKHWVRYYVWADSFEVYLAARERAEKRGFEVGWQPLQADYQIRIIPGLPTRKDELGPG